MSITPINDTVTYVDDAGKLQAAVGVAILAGSGGGGGDSSAIGSPSDAPWTGTGDGTVIAVLKGIYNQLNLTNTEPGEIDQNTLVANTILNDIKTNTAGEP